MDIKVTKRQILKQWSNSTKDGVVMLVSIRLFDNDKTHYRKFKFIIHNDTNDVWDSYAANYCENTPSNESYFDSHFKQLRDNLFEEQIDSMLGLIVSYDNFKEFKNTCVESLEYYNEHLARK